MIKPRSTAADRFDASYVPEPNSGCWLWIGALGATGYGRFSWDGRDGLAHRASYERFVDFVPDGLDIDHLCRVRSCVNPNANVLRWKHRNRPARADRRVVVDQAV
jgi:hypothetical protein